MTDPIPVRFPCEEHNQWFRHMVQPVGIKPVWCEGGETRKLRFLEECCTRCGNDCFDHEIGVWIEVSDGQ